MQALLPAKGLLAARIFCAFALAYFISYALRAVNAAIAPSLVAELKLSSEQLGSLTSAYFFSFALLQLPLGGWLDRFGPKRVELCLLSVALVGCLLFANAQSVTQLWLARAAIGFGVAACLMAALKGFRLWFEPKQHAQLTAWILMGGTLGVVTTTVPAQWAAQHFGWRALFVAFAVAIALAMALIAWILPRYEAQNVSKTAEPPLSASVFLKDPYFWKICLLGSVILGAFSAIQTLWLGPWLTNVLRFSAAQAAQYMLFINGGLVIGYWLIGQLATRYEWAGSKFSEVALLANAGLLLTLIAIALLQQPLAWLLWIAYMCFAAVNNLSLSHVNLRYPASLAGRVSSTLNFAIFAGAFVVQWSTGALIDYFKQVSPVVAAYQQALWCLIALQAVAWLVFLIWSRLAKHPQGHEYAPHK